MMVRFDSGYSACRAIRLDSNLSMLLTWNGFRPAIRRGVFAFLGALLIAMAMVGPSAAATFPLRGAPNQRYLVDQAGAPFFLHADTPWSLIVALTTNEVNTYLETRRVQGFNTIIVNLIEHLYMGVDNLNGPPRNRAGNGPFTVPGDFASINEAYFAHADWVLRQATSKGMFVIVAPCYMGYPGNGSGWYEEVKANGLTKCRNYGRFVGQRYRSFPNLGWLIWGDRNADDSTPMVEAMVAGLREMDTNHLITAHFQRTVTSRDYLVTEPWLTLDGVYTTDIVHALCLREYHRSPALPLFLIEARYENEHGISTAGLRRQAYTAVLSGATGHAYGNYPVWLFDRGWQSALTSTGAVSMTYVPKLFQSRPWPSLVPDDAHLVVTAGYGADAFYVAAARAADGSTVLAYLPAGGTITVDLRRLSGSQAKAWWFNVRDGTATTIGLYPTTGTVNFSAPSLDDWVLVIDDTARGFGTPGASTGTSTSITVDAGLDQRLNWPPGAVQLGGKIFRNGQLASTGSVSLRWTYSGPGTVTFSPSATVSAPSISLSTAGRYTLLLTAWEGTVTNYDSVIVTAESDDPPNPPSSLQVDGQVNPYGLRNFTPRFSWEFSDANSGDYQGGLRVEVFGITNNLAWDSGKVSAIRSSIDYTGPALTPGASYRWRVTVWDQSGLSTRSTEAAWLTMANVSSELLTNPGFETADTRGWAQQVAGSMIAGTQTPFGRNVPHSGTYHALWMSSSADNVTSQRVELSSYADAIDAGAAWVDANGWLVSDDYQATPPYDRFNFQVRFYNAQGTELSAARYDTGTLNVPNWAQYGLRASSIPVGARSLEVRFNIWEPTYEAGSADDFSVRVYTVPTPEISVQTVTASRQDLIDAGFCVGITANQPGQYLVERSSDFRNWTAVTPITYSGTTVWLTDPDVDLEAGRFYRVRRTGP